MVERAQVTRWLTHHPEIVKKLGLQIIIYRKNVAHCSPGPTWFSNELIEPRDVFFEQAVKKSRQHLSA
jgi:hypothetical protein